MTATGPDAKDEDDDLRQLLQAAPVATSPAHDEAVRRAALDSARRRVGRSAAPRWMALAAVLVLVVLGTLWRVHEPGSVAQARRPATTSRSTTLPAVEVKLVVDAVLAPGLTRGAAALPEISIGSRLGSVQLALQGPATLDVNDIVLILNTRAGKEVWRSPASQAHAVTGEGVLTVAIPVSALAPGQYELSVRSHIGATDSQADYYYFEVNQE